MTHTLFWIAECRQNWHPGFQSQCIGLIGCWNLSDVDLYDNKKNVISTVEIKLLCETLSSPRPRILLSSFSYFYILNDYYTRFSLHWKTISDKPRFNDYFRFIPRMPQILHVQKEEHRTFLVISFFTPSFLIILQQTFVYI